jgi:hypothetical protein
VKIMIAAISASDMAVPKSGSSRIKPTRQKTTIPIGVSEYDTSLMRCIRRSRMAAIKKMALSFASSDGCTPMPP